MNHSIIAVVMGIILSIIGNFLSTTQKHNWYLKIEHNRPGLSRPPQLCTVFLYSFSHYCIDTRDIAIQIQLAIELFPKIFTTHLSTQGTGPTFKLLICSYGESHCFISVVILVYIIANYNQLATVFMHVIYAGSL